MKSSLFCCIGLCYLCYNKTKEIASSPGLQWKPIASHTGERDDQAIYQKSLMPKALGHFSSQRIIVSPFNCKFQSRHALGCLLKCLFGSSVLQCQLLLSEASLHEPRATCLPQAEESLEQTGTGVPQCAIFFFFFCRLVFTTPTALTINIYIYICYIDIHIHITWSYFTL